MVGCSGESSSNTLKPTIKISSLPTVGVTPMHVVGQAPSETDHKSEREIYKENHYFYMDSFEYFEYPAMRFIGKDVLVDNSLEGFCSATKIMVETSHESITTNSNFSAICP